MIQVDDTYEHYTGRGDERRLCPTCKSYVWRTPTTKRLMLDRFCVHEWDNMPESVSVYEGRAFIYIDQMRLGFIV